MGLNKAGMEAILMCVSLGIFLGYNLWLMVLRPKIAKLFKRKNARVRDFYAAGKVGPFLSDAAGGRRGGREGRRHKRDGTSHLAVQPPPPPQPPPP